MATKVSHPKFGKGELINILPRSGLQEYWLVSFAGGALKTEVPRSELLIVEESGSKIKGVNRADPVSGSEREAQKISPKAAKKERYAIEALRYGLVYTETVCEQTVGLKSLIKKVEELIEDVSQTGQVNFMTLVGPWGSGKTHSLKLCSYLARNRGYATAMVETSSNHNLARSADLHNQIVKNLVPHNMGVVTGPSVFVEKYCRTRSFRDELKSLKLLGPAFELAHRANKKNINLTDAVINFFSGDYNLTRLRTVTRKEGLIYPGVGLHPQAVVYRAQRFAALLREWAQVARAYHQRNQGGLVVLLDEAELFADLERSPESLRRASHVLIELQLLRKKKDCPLLFVFATTTLDDPNDPLAFFVESYDIHVHHLDLPKPAMAEEVAKNIIRLYGNAYTGEKFNIDEQKVLDQIKDKVVNQDFNLRAIIRSLIDQLDILSAQ